MVLINCLRGPELWASELSKIVYPQCLAVLDLLRQPAVGMPAGEENGKREKIDDDVCMLPVFLIFFKVSSL